MKSRVPSYVPLVVSTLGLALGVLAALALFAFTVTPRPAPVLAQTSVDLALTKTASPDPVAPGALLTYNLEVTNPGTDSETATGVSVTDTLPAEVTFSTATPSQGSYDSSTGIWTVGTLGASGSATLELVVTVNSDTTDGTVLTNTAVAAADQEDSDPSNATAVSETTVQATSGGVVDLSLTKTASPDTVAPGALLTYNLEVTNPGTDSETATGVSVTDTLPDEVTFSTATPSQGSYDSSTGIWTVGTLGASGSATLELVVTVNSDTPDGTVLTNTAVAAADQEDSDPSNDTAVSETTVQATSAGVVDLSLTKTDFPDPVTQGALLTYNLEVTNPATGAETATGVFVTDTLPAEVTFSSATPSQGSYDSSTGIWTVGTLGTTGSATLELVVTVNLDTAVGTVVTNTAVVSGDQEDPDLSNNTAVSETTVEVVDTDPPTCETTNTGVGRDGREFREIRFEDSGSGLARIALGQVNNAEVESLEFEAGPTGPVLMTLQQRDANGSAIQVRFILVDLAGNQVRRACSSVLPRHR